MFSPLAKLRSLLRLPGVNASSNTRTAYFLTVLAGATMVVIVVLILFLPFSAMTSTVDQLLLVMDVGLFALCAALVYAAWHGHARFAAQIFAVLIYLSSVLPTLFIFGTISSPTILGFFILIPLSGLMLDSKVATRYFWLCTKTLWY